MSDNLSSISSDELRASLREARAELRLRDNFTEEDTRNALISPFLDSLGYDALRRRSEYSDRGNTPDEVIYAEYPGMSPSRYCQIILEAKPLKTDFDRGPSRTETPERQLKRYLRNHQAVGPNTYGILTDGERYRVYQRTGNLTDIQYRGEYNILDTPPLEDAEQTDAIDELFEILHRDVLRADIRSRDDRYGSARQICELIANSEASSGEIFGALCSDTDDVRELSQDGLAGRTKDAHQNDWHRSDWCYGPSAEVVSPRLDDGSPSVVIACVEYNLPDGSGPVELRRGDVSLAARAFAEKTDCRTAVVIARQPDSGGMIDRARIAVQYLGHTGMTSEFDPHHPPMSVLRAVQRIVDVLRRSTPVSGQQLSDAVTVKTIRKEFYEAISNWTLARQRGRSERYRQTVLRHLIRTVFAWILKEDGIIPIELFEESFARSFELRNSNSSYHHDVLMQMFHEGLNKHANERGRHNDRLVAKAIEDTPFLNGSLFAQHDGDADLALKLCHYFGVSDTDPGLFTIMSRYDWTTSEHTPGESDQTIDPEMLSNLFENLFAAGNEDDDLQVRMPRGTYYTPSDVVAEMVKDALTAASEPFAPPPYFVHQ